MLTQIKMNKKFYCALKKNKTPLFFKKRGFIFQSIIRSLSRGLQVSNNLPHAQIDTPKFIKLQGLMWHSFFAMAVYEECPCVSINFDRS
jgi:hypothetical protein